MYSLKEEKISQITPFSVLADNKRIRNKTIDGKSTQATRSGKNKMPFPIDTFPKTGADGVLTASKNDDGTIQITGNKTTTGWSTVSFNFGETQHLPAGTYTLQSGMILGTKGESTGTFKNVGGTFTYTEDWTFSTGYWQTKTTGEKDIKLFPMLVEGSYTEETFPDFEPYGASPSPEFPSEIKSVGDEGTVTIEQRGKNEANVIGNQSITNHGITLSVDNNQIFTLSGTHNDNAPKGTAFNLISKLKTANYINYMIGDKSTILKKGTYIAKIDILSENVTGEKNGIVFGITTGTTTPAPTTTIGILGDNNSLSNTFTLEEENSIAFVLAFMSSTIGTVINDLKFRISILEETETTDYEPYFSKDYVLQTKPLRSLPNGTKDTIEEDGIHRRVGSVVLDGSENWIFGTQYQPQFGNRFDVRLPNLPGAGSYEILCDYFKYIEPNKGGCWANISSKLELRIQTTMFSTVTELKTWLSTHNTEVLYELSEEVVEPFTEEQQAVLNSMETLEGTNHFSLIGDLQTTLTFDYNPKITEEIKRAFKYNITKAYLEVAATDKDSGFQINEDNYLQSIDFDDCRYIEGEGIIGSCVAKELQGKFVNVDTSFDIENRELDCFIGAETEDNITHYLRLGTFIVQKPENDNVKDNTSFDSLDYMIKFNKEYVHRMAKYLKTKDIDIIKDKQYYILTESGAYEEVIVPHKEEISNYYELIDEYTLMQLLKDICEQCEVKLGTFNFRNADYVVHGNRFDTGTTCRDVLKAIAQAAFSWARINEYNELLLDFETSDTISEEIDYNEYYNLSFNDKYGPVNTIVLKNSQVEGENITVQDETLVKNYGIKELAISDNPFAYSEETRKAIIEAGKMLYGFTYVPLTVETIGAAYLNCKDKIKVKNMQDGDLETYLFDTRISYQGTLKSNVETLAMTDTETKYRYDGSLTTAQRRTEYRVDKAEQKMTSLVKLTTEQGEKLTEAVQDLDGFKRTIINKTDETNEKITTIEETVNGLVTEKSVSGGQNLIKNSVGYFGNDYWQINETTEGKVLNDNSTDVKQNSISGSALKLQAETIYQDIKEIKNGEYYLSFNYKRIINTAIATLKVNDLIINLTEENWKEEAHLINVTTNNIRIEITTDLNSSILITDLMLTEGNIKVSWTQNANESYTDTVQIGKGVRITATGSDTEFVAEATGITINNTETGGKVAEFTKYGTETQELVAHKDVKVADSLLIQKIGNQTWFSSL